MEDPLKRYLRAPCALLLTCGVLAGLPLSSGGRAVLAAETDPDTDTVNACVGFRSEEGEKLLIVHAKNDCRRALTCSLTYNVRCEDNDRNVTSRAEKKTPFELASKGKTQLTLSATGCLQGWAIDNLAWTCH